MNIVEAKDKKAWDNFIISNGDQFLQSWEWAEFQKKLNRKIWRLDIKDGDNIVGQALLIKHVFPLGKSYLYCPRGPIASLKIKDQRSKIKNFFEFFINHLDDLAKQENAIFLRIEPLSDSRFEIKDLKRINDVQPSQTLMLDLAHSKEKILSQMHEKTRYNIRLAQRHGVKVGESDDIKIFLDLLHETAKREKFKSHPDMYYRTLLNTNSHFTKLYTATYKGKVLAAHMMIFSGLTATYVHGASSREYKEVMAPHLLHWYTIQIAKQKGYQWYDLWGIDEKKWPGLTRFKKGFGGDVIAYPGTFDLPLDKFWYGLYRVGASIKQLFC
ncbi:aminoacyltransferase [Patescibacteria group bacterium AH-259-L07]|nr:aminoacyltransferase [Patescibacteria group bacterium AH-259-L07]